MASSYEKKFFDIKLDFLEEQHQRLHSVISDMIDEVVTTGRNWGSDDTEREVKRPFRDISQMVEDAVLFVSEKCTELQEGGIQGNCVAKNSPNSLQTDGQLSSSSAQSQLQDEMSSLKPRTQKMEEAVRMITANLEDIMERQTNIENTMGNQSVRLSQTESKWVMELSEMKKNMKDFGQKEGQIQSLEKQLQTVVHTQNELRKHHESATDDKKNLVVRVEKIQKDMGNIVIDVKILKDQMQGQEEKLEGLSSDVEKVLKENTAERKPPHFMGESSMGLGSMRPFSGAPDLRFPQSHFSNFGSTLYPKQNMRAPQTQVGKEIDLLQYDRQTLINLQDHPLSQRRPKGLPDLEIVLYGPRHVNISPEPPTYSPDWFVQLGQYVPRVPRPRCVDPTFGKVFDLS